MIKAIQFLFYSFVFSENTFSKQTILVNLLKFYLNKMCAPENFLSFIPLLRAKIDFRFFSLPIRKLPKISFIKKQHLGNLFAVFFVFLGLVKFITNFFSYF
jgi:hypothetical protein